MISNCNAQHFVVQFIYLFILNFWLLTTDKVLVMLFRTSRLSWNPEYFHTAIVKVSPIELWARFNGAGVNAADALRCAPNLPYQDCPEEVQLPANYGEVRLLPRGARKRWLPLRHIWPEWSPQLFGNANSAGPHWIMRRIPVSKQTLLGHRFWFAWPFACVKSSLIKRKRTSANPSTDLDLSKWYLNHFKSISKDLESETLVCCCFYSE